MSARVALSTVGFAVLLAPWGLAQAPGPDRAGKPILSRKASRELWNPTLTEKNQRRVLKRCDRRAVSFYLSEPGRWSKADQYDDLRNAARYAARKILSSQLEVMRPEVLETWKEAAISLRSRQPHGGEVQAGPSTDIDVGLRSGRPFVGTNVAGARLTLEWDWRRDRTAFAATRPLGPVNTRFELRHGADDEVRLSLSIPVSW